MIDVGLPAERSMLPATASQFAMGIKAICIQASLPGEEFGLGCVKVPRVDTIALKNASPLLSCGELSLALGS